MQERFEEQDLIITPRGHKQNMDQAMRGKIERGLVELITNADDSYRDLAEARQPVNGSIRIEIERRRNQASIVTVKDRAEGMSRDEMRTKLTKVGQRTSGFETGLSRRGLLGRGSRDVAAFGRVSFESIQDDRYNNFVIETTLKTHFTEERPRIADEKIRTSMGLLKGNGTKVTIEVDSRFSIPSHDNCVRILSRYYSLRDIMSDPNRKVTLVDVGQHREDKLSYLYPEGQPVYESEMDVQGYPEAKSTLRLELHDTPFQQDKTPEREGVLIKSGASIHDSTYFGLEAEPLAWRFSGSLYSPLIDKLLREYDDEEEGDSGHSKSNPFRLLSPDRDGLLAEHPFTKALVAAARTILEAQVEQLRSKEGEGKRKVTNSKLSDRLKALSRSVSQVFAQKLMDLDAELDPGLSDGGPVEKMSAGLHIIPGGDIPIVAGEPKTFSLILKQRDIIPVGLKIEVETTNPDILVMLKDEAFKDIQDDSFSARTTFTLLGVDVGEESLITIKTGSWSNQLSVRVVEAGVTVEPEEGFWFEKSKYRLKPGKEKKLTLKLKTSSSNPDLHVTINSTNQTIVTRGGGQCDLKASKVPGIYVGTIIVVGRQDKTRGSITAHLPHGIEAETEIIVDERKQVSGFELRFEPEEEDYNILRYKWDLRDPYLLKIGAKHVTVRKYLGELTDGVYLGIDSTHYRTVLAELIAEALAFRLLRTVFDREGENKRLDYEATDFYYHKYHSEFLELAQTMLLETDDIAAISAAR